MNRVDVIIGICPKCGRPLRSVETARLRPDGLHEHVTCPLVSLYLPNLGGDAA